jgi:hypothetical protein
VELQQKWRRLRIIPALRELVIPIDIPFMNDDPITLIQSIPPELQMPPPRAFRAKLVEPERGQRASKALLIFLAAAWFLYQIFDPLIFFNLPTVPATYLGGSNFFHGKSGQVRRSGSAMR